MNDTYLGMEVNLMDNSNEEMKKGFIKKSNKYRREIGWYSEQ